MTLLELINAALGEMGLAQPTAVVGNSDPQVTQLLALINKVGNGLVTNYIWQRLDKEYRFNTVVIPLTGTITSGSPIVTGLSSTASLAANTFQVTGDGIPVDCYIQSIDSSTQVTLNQDATESGSKDLTFTQTKYPLPSDWSRSIQQTDWDQTNHWQLIGPVTAQEWQFLKSGIVATGPRIRYRLLENKFQIWPPATSTSRLGFEYMSKNWVIQPDGDTYASQFTDDADTCVFSDRLMITALKYEFMAQKGFDVTALGADLQFQLDKEYTADKGGAKLSMGRPRGLMFIGPGSVQDGNYPH